MSKLGSTFGSSRAALLVLLAGCAAAPLGCSKEEAPKTAWNCQTTDVPMGEVVRCSTAALTSDGTIDTGGTTDTGGVTRTTPGDGTIYECNAGEPLCPPIDTTGGSGGTSDGTTGGTSDTGTSGGGTSGTGGTGTTDGTSDTGASGGTTSGGAGGTSDGTTGGKSDNGNGSNGNGGGSSAPGPDECAWVSEIPYCGGDGSSSSSSSGSSTCEGPQCDAPGQTKKNGGTGDGAASSSSGGSSGSGKGRHYKCEKKNGDRECESVPDCASGTHSSACGACVPDGETADCVPPSAGGCWVTGGGFVVGPNVTTGAVADGHDNFGGNAKPMKDGRIQGHWNHVDHGTGNHAKGKPEYIVCRHVDEPGPGQPGGKKGFTMNQVYFGGPAEWRSNGAWAGGYWFDVVAKDHGEPGSQPHVKNGGMPDTYHFTVRKMDDPTKQVSGAIAYEAKGDLQGGNIQLHPPNNGHPYTPSALPSWVSYEP